MTEPLEIVILGLAVTSSWGNGHATTYRGLIRGLAARGHSILFLERDMPWYAGNRDEPHPAGAITELYNSFDELVARFERPVSEAGLVIVGSFVPDGVRVGEWVTSIARGRTAFYDIDTPITMAKLAAGEREYITPELIRRYNAYLSFTGGPALSFIQNHYGSPMARVLYCSVDPAKYRPRAEPNRWDLGYLGTYSEDRQPTLEALMLEPARQWTAGRFAVVGPLYPENLEWPANVQREIHLSPREHPAFYSAQRFTLNVTREAMKLAGYSPSVRLFEAGACGVPVISDWWTGLDSLFAVGKDVLVAADSDDTLRYLRDLPEGKRRAIGDSARGRVLADHTPERRALQLEGYLKELDDNFSAHTPRRNRRGGELDRGLDAGLASQPSWESAGGTSDKEFGGGADPGGLHQPAGARH